MTARLPVEVPIPWEKPEWMLGGACRGAPQAIFFPGRGAAIEPARRICAGCDVRDECLEYALDNHEKGGIWGGAGERERRRIARQRKAAA